jgi:DNA polymerase III alpha subunit
MLSRLRFALPSHDQLMLFDLWGARDALATNSGFTKSMETLLDYDRIAKLEAELDVTGIPFCMHPAMLLPKRYVPADCMHKFRGQRVTVAGFVATARRARTNDNRVMGFVTIEDAAGLIEVSFFPDKLVLYRTICSYGGPVWVSGTVTEHLASLSLDCTGCGRMGTLADERPDAGSPLSPPHQEGVKR